MPRSWASSMVGRLATGVAALAIALAGLTPALHLVLEHSHGAEEEPSCGALASEQGHGDHSPASPHVPPDDGRDCPTCHAVAAGRPMTLAAESACPVGPDAPGAAVASLPEVKPAREWRVVCLARGPPTA